MRVEFEFQHGDEFTPEQVRRMLGNPFYAITCAEVMTVEHEPMVTREQWVKANVQQIAEMGAEAWLTQLLDVLERGA